MSINTKEIENVEKANEVLKNLKISRLLNKNKLFKKTVLSKFTGKEGIITDIDNKFLYVNFEAWESIPLSLDKYIEAIDTDDETIETINNYKESFKDERRLNLLIGRMNKKS